MDCHLREFGLLWNATSAFLVAILRAHPAAYKSALKPTAAESMGGMPARHKRAMAPLGEAARARLWGSAGACSSGGSERSAEGSSPELADLFLDSFYGDGNEIELDEDSAMRRRQQDCAKGELGWSEREMLKGMVSLSPRDRVGSRIRAEAESAWRSIGTHREEKGEDGWQRRLMLRLREKGFDAGLCECRGEKTAQLPAVAHEYVDVVASGGTARYIVEPNLAAEFQIARPTPHYLELFGILPAVFVGRHEALKDIVRVMCAAAAGSMRSREMHVPPWRRREYVQGKWFGPYRRVTSGEPNGGAPSQADLSSAASVVIGYQQKELYCRVECPRREGLKGRKLAVRL